MLEGIFKKPVIVKDDSEEVVGLKEQIIELQETNRKKDVDQEIEIKKLTSAHELEIKEKEFEIKHLESEKVQDLETKLVDANSKIAVFTKQVEMLDKIVDLNADVIDVKDLVTKLIDKLPEIKLTTLAGSAPVKNKDN